MYSGIVGKPSASSMVIGIMKGLTLKRSLIHAGIVENPSVTPVVMRNMKECTLERNVCMLIGRSQSGTAILKGMNCPMRSTDIHSALPGNCILLLPCCVRIRRSCFGRLCVLLTAGILGRTARRRRSRNGKSGL
ncbi:uncharacterized protein LOC100770072 isoform X3 [Cricetulus griseus]|uniref:Uncharacterized protein LOC100770072 isoform X3 n=1 Tax=Cricetulus griseus TaxID=10029 RepID=A0A9J7GZT1_CRIGR|nr:uncharacterized protein LOC100770072 isoform X3 [Cricetulus griseus]